MHAARTRSKRIPMLALPLLVPALLASACTTVGPDYQEPTSTLPGAYVQIGSADGISISRKAADEAALASWWKLLKDPTLDTLVQKALRNHPSVHQAAERVIEARARAGIVSSQLQPVLDANASALRTGRTHDGGDQLHSAGLDATWEIDLFGRIERSKQAAFAELDASRDGYHDVMRMLVAEIALAYTNFRVVQQRVGIAEANVALQQQSLDLASARFGAGLVTELDVTQAQANLETTRSSLPALRAEAETLVMRLGVLTGDYPSALRNLLTTSASVPSLPMQLQIGVPANLLRRRPDIRQAERELAAQSARIGVAEADLYPRLTLLGSIGVQADEFGNLFRQDAGIFSIGPAFTWNLFDGGRTRRAIEMEESLMQQAMLGYEATVREAVLEVDSAVARLVQEHNRLQGLNTALVSALRSVEIANSQYSSGLVTYQTVLDSLRTRQALDDQVALSRASLTLHGIALFKALGGGWQDQLDAESLRLGVEKAETRE